MLGGMQGDQRPQHIKSQGISAALRAALCF